MHSEGNCHQGLVYTASVYGSAEPVTGAKEHVLPTCSVSVCAKTIQYCSPNSREWGAVVCIYLHVNENSNLRNGRCL